MHSPVVPGIVLLQRPRLRQKEGGNLPLNHALPNAIPQRLEPIKHRIPLLILIHPAPPLRARPRRPRRLGAHAPPLRSSEGLDLILGEAGDAVPFGVVDVVGEAVGERDELDEKEVEAGAAQEGGGGVAGVVGRLRAFEGHVGCDWDVGYCMGWFGLVWGVERGGGCGLMGCVVAVV